MDAHVAVAAGGEAIRLRVGTVATAVAGAVAYGLAHRDLGEITHMGIDEQNQELSHYLSSSACDGM